MSIKINVSTSLKGYTLIVGFPGIGLVGPIVARHIIDSRRMKLVGTVTSPDFPAVMTIRNGVALPPVRIYADEDRKIAVIVSEIAFSEDNAKKMGEAIVKMATEQGIERIISIAGVLIPSAGGSAIWGAANHPDSVKYLMKHGVSPVEKGITTGISASLLLNGQASSVDVILILGALHAKEDFRAAAEVVRKLDEMLGLEIPYETLLQRAEEIEREVSKIVSQSKRQDSPMYG